MSNNFPPTQIVDISGFPIPKHGCLMRYEQKWMTSQKTKQVEALQSVMRLAQKISIDSAKEDRVFVTPEAALDMLLALGSDPASNTILVNYAEEIDVLLAAMSVQEDLTVSTATMLIGRVPAAELEAKADILRDRYGVELLAEIDYTAIRQYLEDYAIEQTAPNIDKAVEERYGMICGNGWTQNLGTDRLPVTTITQLANFFENEFVQWKPAENKGTQTLGESSPSTKSTSPPAKQTGKVSTMK